MATLSRAEARRASASRHADRSEQCQFCGRHSFGNGGKVAHARSHVRKGEAVELFKFRDIGLTSRLFFAPDDDRIPRFIAEGFDKIEPRGT